MARDREIAEAISDGINCIHAIATALRAGASPSPDPAWLAILQKMEHALDGVIAKEVKTSMTIREEDRDRVHEVSKLIADWTTTNQPPPELQDKAETVLRLFGVRT